MPIRIMAIRSLCLVIVLTTPPTVPQMIATIGIHANQGIVLRIDARVYMFLPFVEAVRTVGCGPRPDQQAGCPLFVRKLPILGAAGAKTRLHLTSLLPDGHDPVSLQVLQL